MIHVIASVVSDDSQETVRIGQEYGQEQVCHGMQIYMVDAV